MATTDYDAHVLILGGSFTGVELVRRLRRDRRGRKLEILVVDRQRQHPYIPLCHELLTERMATGVEQRTILPSADYVQTRPPARWEQGEIISFDPESHTVYLDDGRSFSGRFVVVALGSELRPPWELEGRERLLSYKSQAEFEACKVALAKLLHGREHAPAVLVVGGGISGVEMAGELAHLARSRPEGWAAPRVTLVHGGARLLPALDPHAGEWAAAALRRQGVELLLETRLQSVEDGHAVIRNAAGERIIPCELGLWGGGLQPPPVLEHLGLPLDPDGWLRVGPTLQCFPETTDEPEIFAGGDVARIYGGTGRWPTMQRAIEGIFAATTMAENILELARHGDDYPEGVPPLQPHRLWDDFPHGVSAGGESLVVYGRMLARSSRINIWFRRFLMRRYMARYSVN